MGSKPRILIIDTRFEKGHIPWNKGKHKYTCCDCGKPLAQKAIRCRQCFKQQPNPFYKKQHSSSTLRVLSAKAKLNWSAEEYRKSVLDSRFGTQTGKNNPRWKGGVTPLASAIRQLPEYRQWCLSLFLRDNYTCLKCQTKIGKLEGHHKKPFCAIFKEFLELYSQFSPLEDQETLVRLALSYPPFWNLANGETLCHKCHELTDTYRRKAEKWVANPES